MKILIIMRHARTEPDSPDGDFARRLTAKGAGDAVAAAERIAALNLQPDQVVTSGAARALATAKIVANRLDADEQIAVDSRIYDADVETLFRVLKEIPDECGTVLMVGHNPGVEDLVDQLVVGRSNAMPFTPAAFAVIGIDAGEWKSVGASGGVVQESWRQA